MAGSLEPLTVPQRKELIVNMTALGATLEECRLVSGVAERTIRSWRSKDQKFRDDMDSARLRMQHTLKSTAFKMARGGDKTMLIFLLKTMCGLRETGVTDTTIIVEDGIGQAV